MRLPLATDLRSRDGTVTKDAKCKNAVLEETIKDGEPSLKMRRRPGLVDTALIRAGVAQLLTYWRGLFVTVQADYINIGTQADSTHVTTWDPANKGSTMTLTNGNLTATASSAGHSAVRTVITAPVGGWYAEITVGPGNIFYDIGMANASFSIETQLGATANSISYRASSGNIVKNNVSIFAAATYTVGAVIGIFHDATSNTIAFYKNGVLQYTVASVDAPTGSLYMAFSCGGSGANGAVTANFGATAFTYAAPVGSTFLNPTNASLPFSGQDNGADAPTPYLMVKNASQAWVVNQATGVTQITDVDYPGTYTVTLTSLTRSGTVATATTAADTNFQVGSTVTIAGATPSTYNGAQIITSITPSIATSTTPVLITITRSGTTATATSVSEPHGLINSQSVTIEGASQPEYNGIFTITYINHTQFSYTVTTVNGVTTPATGSPVSGLDVPLYFTFLGSGTAFTATYGPGNFDFLVGDSVILNGWSAFGIPDAAYTVVTSTQTGMGAGSFTFTVAGFVGTFAGIGIGGRAKRDPAFTVSSITNDGLGTATATTSAAHGYLTGASVTISGAAQSAYNGTLPITRTSSTTFTYALASGGVSPETPATGTITVRVITNTGSSFTFDIAGAPATPATGTITAAGGRNTVPGIGYLDGLFAVMDVYGVIYNSEEDNPSSWLALEFVTALAETGLGKAIARSGNYIAGFKEYSTEFFWKDPSNGPGSPFSEVPNLFTNVGCASGFSVADVAGRLVWIAQSKKQKGRTVYMMLGAEQKKVSTPDVERILDKSTLADVRAFGVTLGGHPCYVLTIVDLNITLVYDLQSQVWGEWSSLTIGSNKSITSITRSGTTATVTFALAHGMSDGDPLKISGANQSDYSGIFQVSYVSATVVTIEVANSPVTPATGTLIGNTYTESYFKFPCYASGGGYDAVLHESDGHLYYIDATLKQDAGLPINQFARTEREDGKTLRNKKLPRLALVADSVADTAMIRWSDDDCQTFEAYRRITLSDAEPMLTQCGAFRRRTIEYRHIGNTAPVIEALELEVSQ